jgi:hypothetical protein
MRVRLYDIAHARAGDKGDTSTLSLLPYDDALYPQLVSEVTAARVKAHLAAYVNGDVIRYELPNLCALQFVCQRSLGGGVTTSLALDAHGKGLSYHLLSMEIELNPP